MFLLEIHIDGHLLDTYTPCQFLLRTKYAEHLTFMMNEMMKKHADTLTKKSCKPFFILSGVRSCINCFVPLRHP